MSTSRRCRGKDSIRKKKKRMCCKTGGEKLTRAASQENVLGDIISFCAGSVRLGAGDGKASSRCLSFVTHGGGGKARVCGN